MEALVALLVIGLLCALPLLLAFAVISWNRTAGVERELKEVRGRIDVLERRLAALRPARPEGPEPASTTLRTPAPASIPARPAPPPAVPTEAPPRPAPASPPPSTPPPAASPASPRPAPPRPAIPPAPPIGPARPPLAPPAPPFDWESLIGLKGAAWAGGVALVIAALLLAKLAYDKGLLAAIFTPPIRIATLTLAGAGALAWAELSLRRGYSTTANAVSGAGIAVLYIAFYSGHALYALFSLGVTFALMGLVTVVAGLVAVRYDALFTAVLGLLGGFLTPLLLSTGEDRPFGLFSYVLLLNLGLVAVALRRRWFGLVMVGALFTTLIQVGWYLKFMQPGNAAVGLGVFLMFGLLYLALPELPGAEGVDALKDVGSLGSGVSLVLALILATRGDFAGEWPLLFGYLGLLDAVLIWVALARKRLALVVGASAATALSIVLWAQQGLNRDTLWGPIFAALALAALLNAPARLAARFKPDALVSGSAEVDLAGLGAAAGLALLSVRLLVQGLGEPPWAFLVLLAAVLAASIECRRPGRTPVAFFLGSLTTGLLAQAWFHSTTRHDTLVRNLGILLLHAIVVSLAVGLRQRSDVGSAQQDELGSVGVTLLFVAGLLGCLVTTERGADPVPLFAALAVAVGLLVTSALRRGWTRLVLVSLGATALFASCWHVTYYAPSDLDTALSLYGLAYVAFLGAPFGIAALVPAWRTRLSPWIASALSGPVFFPILYDAIVRGWGKAWIGALPVALAAATLAALAGVSRRFTAAPGHAQAELLRLRFLALFSAVALGFIAIAIPLQLERQWLTLGWALEGAAVFWLFRRLPHPGLRAFGALLFAGVAARLLLNPEILRYQEHRLPILNWILYTYGVAALACFVAAWQLRRADDRQAAGLVPAGFPGLGRELPPAVSLLGLVLVFWLVNLEIFDYFSPRGHFIDVSLERHLARDLALSAAWGLYALCLLVLGMWRGVRPLRYVSLGFLLLTVAKVFLYDLSNLTGVYRILSFLGLGSSLILVSLLYQRFVFGREQRT